MKIVFLLYFLMTANEGIEAVQAYQANSLNEAVITAFQTATFAEPY